MSAVADWELKHAYPMTDRGLRIRINTQNRRKGIKRKKGTNAKNESAVLHLAVLQGTGVEILRK